MFNNILEIFKSKPKKETVKIPTIEAIRGLAALMVCLFHYSSATHLQTTYDSRIEHTFSFGYLGVQIFFVISGFVITLSQFNSSYVITDFFRFTFKRIVRINLPYYGSIILLLGLVTLPLLLFNKPISGVDYDRYTLDSLIYHVFVIVNFTNYDWYNAVYWTLAVEYQFYIFIGLLFPLLIKALKLKPTVFLFFLAIIAMYYIPFASVLFFSYIVLFAFGVVGFLYYQKLISVTYFIIIVSSLTLFGCFQLPFIEICFGLGALLLILFVRIENKLLLFIGKVSYSLYITHTFAAYLSEMLLKRILPLPTSLISKCLMLGVYALIGILFAYLFYRLVELPSIELSKKIKLVKNKKEEISHQ